MTARQITPAEIEEAWVARTSWSGKQPVRSIDVLVIRSTLNSRRRLEVVVSADDERVVSTVADQDQEDR